MPPYVCLLQLQKTTMSRVMEIQTAVRVVRVHDVRISHRIKSLATANFVQYA